MPLDPDIAAVLAGESKGCVVCARAEDVLPQIPDESVDLICTDPPYVGLHGGHDRANFNSGVGISRQAQVSIGDKWEASLDWATEAKRIVKFGAIVFCTHHGLPETAIAFQDWRRAVLWTWHKRNAPPTGANVPHFTEENAWGFAKQPGLEWGAIAGTLIDIPMLQAGCIASPERLLDATGKAIHPTQKPIEVMERVLVVARRGMVVCDPFCGLGATLIAAKNLGCRYIGIDISEKYCAIARARLAATPEPLFAPLEPVARQAGLYEGEGESEKKLHDGNGEGIGS